MNLDYYGILGISRSANLEEIQRAYRQLSLKYHPYRYKGTREDNNVFYYLAEAYDVLSSPKYKSLYDQYGEAEIKNPIPQPPGPNENTGRYIKYTFHGDPYKVFREFFGIDNPFAELKLSNVDPEYKFYPIPEEPKKQGSSKTITFPITLEDVFHGCKKTLKVSKTVFDEYLGRTVEETQTFQLNIPIGCPSGRKFIFTGASDRGLNVIPGDVIFISELQPHDKFMVEGKDLMVRKTIFLAQALTGGVIDVTTFDGKELHLPITGIVKPNDRIPIENEGLPIENTDYRGKFIVIIEVEFPDRFSNIQRQLVKEALLKNP